MASNERLDEQGLARLIELLVNELEKYATLKDLEGIKIDGANSIQSIEQTTTSTEDGGVNIVTVTLTNGEIQVFQIRNGSEGRPGYSPKASVERIDTGVKISITDSSGTTEAEVYDGVTSTDKLVLKDTETDEMYRLEVKNGDLVMTKEV